VSRYEITFARSARRELEALETRLVARVWARIQALANQPRPPGCRKVQGEEDVWWIRVGDYRMLYEVKDAARIIDIVAVRHRRDAYR
jgi:mRNA interferase RelE/StbE